jgi:hypothetical protein
MNEAFVGEEERKEEKVWVGRELLFELQSEMREKAWARFFPGELAGPRSCMRCMAPANRLSALIKMMETRS